MAFICWRKLVRIDKVRYFLTNTHSAFDSSHCPLPMPSLNALSFRQATETDIAFLLELRRVTMSSHQVASGVTPTNEERLTRVRAAFECAQIIEFEVKPIGLLKVVRGDAEWQLQQIQLMPEFQRKGLGSAIVGSLIEEARSAGVGLRLHVLKVNPAKRLYERVGFAVERENDHAYEMVLGSS
jgi:ribosomal protein S18 acetylase RimI-like enzyme